MRTFIFFLCTTVFSFNTPDMFSQEKILIDKDQLVTVDQVFKIIKKQTDYRFIYPKKAFKKLPKVQLKKGEIKLSELLKKSLSNNNLSFELTENNNILIKKIPIIRDVEKQKSVIVNGTVIDTDGQPLPSASIIEKGTNNGTTSDFDGVFSLTVTDQNSILVVSFLGFLTQEVAVNEKTTLVITLQEDAANLDEVVLVGYGTARKQDVTGAIAIADLKTYEAVPVNNVFETVKGTVPGLSVGPTTSAGQVGSLNIRGINTPTASNAPLVVVDGVIFNGSLADIQSQDVKSFTVLKDASAAAVYGARSANGVILIETKSGGGINGKPNFFFNASLGISNQLKPLELFDGPGYIQRVLDLFGLEDIADDPNLVAAQLNSLEADNYLATPDHKATFSNAYDLISQIGYNSKVNLGVSQSNEKSDYYISLSLTDQEGIRIGDQYKNINARVNIKSELTDWFTLGIKSYYGRRDYSGIERHGSFQLLSPYASLYKEDGSYEQFPQNTTSLPNPFTRTLNVNNSVNNTLNAIMSAIIKLPVEGLTYTMNYSNTLNWSNREYFYDENTEVGLPKNGLGGRSVDQSYSYLLDNIVNYNRVFADKHKVDLTLLYSREYNKSKSLSGTGENYSNTILLDYGLENALTQRVSAGGGESASVGKMARLGYSFDDKYALTATVREDGFSAFSSGNKFATFYSFGANWNVSKEKFLQNSNTIDNLAIRASYGKNGNPSVSPYSTLAQTGFGRYILGNEEVLSQGLRRLSLSVFGWETTTALNLGVDFALLDHRISGSLEVYKSRTNDLLFDRPLPAPAGTSSLKDNVGEIENKGIELDLSTINVQKENFSWSSNFVFSLNRNKVVTITGVDNDGDGIEDDLISNGYFIGKPLGTIYGYKVIDTWQEGDNFIDGVQAGDYKVEDIDGDGLITSDMDRQFLGNSSPNFRWSFTNTFTYKNWSVLAYVYSIWGGNDRYLSMNNTPYYDNFASKQDINGVAWNYWTPTNTDTPWPRVGYNNGPYYRATKAFDRSFIKLQKVAISYDMSDIVMGVDGLIFSLSADNLATYAPHWEGLDPETNQGLRTGSIPSIRTFLLSLMLNF